MEDVLITNWNKGTNTKFEINEKTNKSESLITKCIKSLNKEISELKGRENLTLKQIERTINGEIKEQDELRGWRFKGNGDVQLLVRVKGVIVNLSKALCIANKVAFKIFILSISSFSTYATA